MLQNIKKIYMIGIKGVGMTMLAEFLVSKGFEVEGSDIEEEFMTDQVLEKAGIKVYQGFSISNISDDIDLFIYSTAYNKKTNTEVAHIMERKKKLMTYAEALGGVFEEHFGVAVVGTHGKTTTTAWLGFVLKEAGKSPCVMVGARVPQLGGASFCGHSDTMLIEADEYQNKLKHFRPKAVLLNNISYDHPDFFPTPADYDNAFIEFIKKIPKKGFLVANYDDDKIRKYAQVNCRAKVISYAIDEAADYVAYDIRLSPEGQVFKVKIESEEIVNEDFDLGEFAIKLSGRHNVYNALAVIAAAIELNVELHEIRTHLEEFTGCARRMELMGKFKGAMIIDDYAHHPNEIKTTVKAVREKYPDNNLRVIFHPHTFTRTKAMLNEFAESFGHADEVVVLDIYGSAREEQGGVHSKDLVEKIRENNNKLNINQTVKHVVDLREAEQYLRDTIVRKDIILLMGAGDVFRVGENLIK